MLSLGHQNLHFYGVPGLPGGPSSERYLGGVCKGRSMHTWVKVPENTDPGIPHNRGGISRCHTDDLFHDAILNASTQKQSNTEPQGVKLRFFDTNR